jgi:hypothetical protein
MTLLILGTFGTLSPRRADAISDEAKKKYIEGVRLAGDDECELAVKRLRDAIGNDGKEGAQKFRGTGINYEDYFPHYYLGTCLDKLGQGSEALRELQESERQGAIKQRAGLYRSLSASLKRLASAIPSAQPTPIVIALVRPTAAPTPPAIPTAPPERTSVPRRTPPATSVPAAQPTARPRPTVTAPISPAPTRPVPTLAAPVSTRPMPTPVPTPAPTAVRPVPTRPAPAPTKEEVRIPDDTLTELRSGIRSYFHGNFDDAITRLEGCITRSNTARFFLAYSLAGKYLLMGPEKDQHLLTRAREVYQKARGGGAKPQGETLISGAITAILEKN